MGASEGPDDEPWRMVPALMPAPGVYNEDVLEGFDFFIDQMGKRGMYATVALNNQWQWSGGFAQYVKWTEGTEPYAGIPYPAKGGYEWDEFQLYCNRFYYNEEAQDIYRGHIEFMVNRNNTFSGIPNSQNPTIMSWQLANEPRAHVRVDPGVADVYDDWIKDTSEFISQMAPKQLVSTGSEGDTPWDTVGNDLAYNHRHEAVGFATTHLWLMNWEFYNPSMSDDEFEAAIAKGMAYVDASIEQAASIGKPVVLEEFGFPRDAGSLNPNAEETRRQQYFKVVFDKLIDNAHNAGVLAGVNFWAWSGDGIPVMSDEEVPIVPPENSPIQKCYDDEMLRPDNCPESTWWRPGDVLTGDPPHETKGWYGVYSHDTDMLQLIQTSATAIASAV
jgi:mannan endo-1,4-beta-mannosidase